MLNVFSFSKGALVLASQSKTRYKLLTDAGVNFIARAANIDEVSLRDSATASMMAATDIALMLADIKAHKVAHDNGEHPSGFVLSADQLLICEEQVLGKPEDMATAGSQLRLLSGKTHQLITAAVIYRNGDRIWHHLETSKLTMQTLSDEFINNYLLAVGDNALRSPGSYQVEGLGSHLFTRIQGCFFAVLGLPLLQILPFLQSHGLALRGQS